MKIRQLILDREWEDYRRLVSIGKLDHALGVLSSSVAAAVASKMILDDVLQKQMHARRAYVSAGLRTVADFLKQLADEIIEEDKPK